MKTNIVIAMIIMMMTFIQTLNAEQFVSDAERANEYAKKGKYEDAIAYYIKALEVSPYDEQVHYNLGVVYGKNEMWGEAIDEYEKVLELNSRHVNAYYNLGIAYGNIEKWDMAFNAFKKLITLDPKDSDAHYNLALIGIILNNKTLIVTEYKILEKIAPDLAVKIEDVIYKANLSIV
jgi:tetratricopeptide (TPR) repeat protein